MGARGVFASLASLALAGCLKPNPEFDEGEGSGASGSASGSGGQHATTDTRPSSAGSMGVETGSGSGSGSSAEASGTTGTNSTTSTTDGLTTTSTTDGQVEQVLLKHYLDLGQCDYPHWCVSEGDLNKPVTAEHWDGECFDSPLAPPFTVDRVGFRVYGLYNAPFATLDFHDYDANVKVPVQQPFASVPLGPIPQAGYLDFTIEPVTVSVQRFCIVVHSGAQGVSQLGLAVDDVPAPVGQSFLALDGPMGCNLQKFGDMANLMFSNPNQWCIDATITKQ